MAPVLNDYLSIEVTNNSRLPLKNTDAKLLHVFEWKREKARLMEARSKQIMTTLQKRIKASSENRQYTLIEDVQYRARKMTEGNDKKWQKKMLSLRQMEERSTKEFREEL